MLSSKQIPSKGKMMVRLLSPPSTSSFFCFNLDRGKWNKMAVLYSLHQPKVIFRSANDWALL